RTTAARPPRRMRRRRCSAWIETRDGEQPVGEIGTEPEERRGSELIAVEQEPHRTRAALHAGKAVVVETLETPTVPTEKRRERSPREPGDVVGIHELAARERAEDVRERVRIRRRQHEDAAGCDERLDRLEKSARRIEVLEQLAREHDLGRLDSE